MRWAAEQMLPVDLGANKSFFKFAISPNDAAVGFQVRSDGTMKGCEAGSVIFTLDEGTWLIVGVNSDYEVQASLASGDTPNGSAVDTWLSCTATRSWTFLITGVDSKTCTLNIALRLVSSGVVLSSCVVGLSATVDL